MDMGISLPNLSNGWLITTAAPPFEFEYDNVLKSFRNPRNGDSSSRWRR